LKQEGKYLHGKNDWPVRLKRKEKEKRFGQALMMEGGIQSAEEALAGQDARIMWISVALTRGMFLKRGPKCIFSP